VKPTPAQPISRRPILCGRHSAAAAVTVRDQPGPRATKPASPRPSGPSHRGGPATSKRIDWRSDTGSGGMSLMMLVCAVALMMILGLVVDGGAKARALDHASAIASEAARAAAATYRPGDVAIDPAVADQAAQDYLTAAGATGSVTVTGLDVSATATLKQDTVFLPLVGIDAFTVTGAGQAQVVYQQGGTP